MKIKLVYIIFDYILKQRCIKLFKSKTQGEEMKKERKSEGKCERKREGKRKRKARVTKVKGTGRYTEGMKKIK